MSTGAKRKVFTHRLDADVIPSASEWTSSFSVALSDLRGPTKAPWDYQYVASLVAMKSTLWEYELPLDVQHSRIDMGSGLMESLSAALRSYLQTTVSGSVQRLLIEALARQTQNQERRLQVLEDRWVRLVNALEREGGVEPALDRLERSLTEFSTADVQERAEEALQGIGFSPTITFEGRRLVLTFPQHLVEEVTEGEFGMLKALAAAMPRDMYVALDIEIEIEGD